MAFDRGSIYVNYPGQYGLRLQPVAGYQYIYPEMPGLIDQLAHYFENSNQADRNTSNTAAIDPVYSQMEEKIKMWSRKFWSNTRAWLCIKKINNEVWEIADSRPCAVQSCHRLQGIAKDVYQVCSNVTARQHLLAAVRRVTEREWGSEEIEKTVKHLKDQRIMLEINGDLLALAIAEKRSPLQDISEYPGGYVSFERLSNN
jgi:magnesium-protoporphyrin IX monomethyl ester (oxidative) cyclase